MTTCWPRVACTRGCLRPSSPRLIRGCAALRPPPPSSNRSGRAPAGESTKAAKPTQRGRRSGATGSPTGGRPGRRRIVGQVVQMLHSLGLDPSRHQAQHHVFSGPSSSANCLINMASPGRSPLDAARPEIGALTEVDEGPAHSARSRSRTLPNHRIGHPKAGQKHRVEGSAPLVTRGAEHRPRGWAANTDQRAIQSAEGRQGHCHTPRWRSTVRPDRRSGRPRGLGRAPRPPRPGLRPGGRPAPPGHLRRPGARPWPGPARYWRR